MLTKSVLHFHKRAWPKRLTNGTTELTEELKLERKKTDRAGAHSRQKQDLGDYVKISSTKFGPRIAATHGRLEENCFRIHLLFNSPKGPCSLSFDPATVWRFRFPIQQQSADECFLQLTGIELDWLQQKPSHRGHCLAKILGCVVILLLSVCQDVSGYSNCSARLYHSQDRIQMIRLASCGVASCFSFISSRVLIEMLSLMNSISADTEMQFGMAGLFSGSGWEGGLAVICCC